VVQLASYVTWTGANGPGIVENLVTRVPGNIFVDLAGAHRWYWDGEGYSWLSGGAVITDSDAYGGKAVHFSTDEPMGGSGGPFATLAPGTYTLITRLKVLDTQDTAPIAHVYVSHNDQPPLAAMDARAQRLHGRWRISELHPALHPRPDHHRNPAPA
jgi:hypothetical protein